MLDAKYADESLFTDPFLLSFETSVVPVRRNTLSSRNGRRIRTLKISNFPVLLPVSKEF